MEYSSVNGTNGKQLKSVLLQNLLYTITTIQISRNQIDYFGPGEKTIPHCKLAANGPESLMKLHHQVSLAGAKKPILINITIEPSQVGKLLFILHLELLFY